MRIRTKLLAVFIPLVVLSIGAAGLLNVLQFRLLSQESREITKRITGLRDTANQAAEEISSIMDGKTLADFTFISRQLKSGFEDHMSNLAKMLDITARSPLIANYMNNPGLRKALEPELRAYLQAVIGNYNLFGVTLIDNNGKVLFREAAHVLRDGAAPVDASLLTGEDDLSATQWYESRLAESKFMHLLARIQTHPELGLTPVADLSCPLKYALGDYAPYQGSRLGFLKLTVNVKELARSILIPRADFVWQLYLTDADDMILVSTDEAQVGKPFTLSIEEKKNNYVISQKIFRGKLMLRLLTSKAQFKEGSRIVNDLSSSIHLEAAKAGRLSLNIDKSIGSSLRQSAYVTAAALLVAMLVILATAGKISRSLGRLAESAKRIASGDLTERPEVDFSAVNEVSELAINLDEMRENLKSQIDNLNMAEKKYRDIFENAMEGMFQATAQGVYANANPALAALLGYASPEELVRETPAQGNLHFSEPAAFDRFFKILKRLGRIAGFMIPFTTKNGSEFWGSLSARLVETPEGAPFIEGSLEDITKRKMAEEASRKFRFIANASKDFMTLINRNYEYEAVNKAYCEVRGLPEYKIIGRTVADIWGRELFEADIKPHLDRCFEGEFVDYEAPIAFEGLEPSHYNVFYSPYRNDQGQVTHAVVVSRDISKRLKAEALEREKVAVEAASKAKSDFLASMSHEIRTPMNAILGMADLLNESDLNDEDKRYVRILQGAGENLLDLINDILDLSKVEAGKLELEAVPFDLGTLVEDTAEFMAFKAREKGLKLFASMDGAPDMVIGDPTRLRQILVNLAGNAIKFTEQGEVEISVSASPEADPSLVDGKDGGKIELLFAVRDTGIGIPEDKMSSIFESYSQVDASTTRKYGGTGLGLTISMRLSAMMGGRIWVEPAPGGGSVFKFTARFDPAQKQAPLKAAAPGVADHVQPGESRPLRILLAEDNENNRLLFTFYLKKTPHQVIQAHDGMQAVERFKEGGIDIVFMDIEMPVMDGHQAARAIREWEKETGAASIPIIALTAHALKGVEQESADAGCSGHMTKPFKKKELLDVLAAHS